MVEYQYCTPSLSLTHLNCNTAANGTSTTWKEEILTLLRTRKSSQSQLNANREEKKSEVKEEIEVMGADR